MHRFLVWRNATEWPKNIEDGFSPEVPETLPQAVSKALSAHKASLPGKVREWRERGRRDLCVCACCDDIHELD